MTFLYEPEKDTMFSELIKKGRKRKALYRFFSSLQYEKTAESDEFYDHIRLGILLREMGDTKAAVEAFSGAEKYASQRSIDIIFFEKSITYKESGNFKDAYKYLQKIRSTERFAVYDDMKDFLEKRLGNEVYG